MNVFVKMLVAIATPIILIYFLHPTLKWDMEGIWWTGLVISIVWTILVVTTDKPVRGVKKVFISLTGLVFVGMILIWIAGNKWSNDTSYQRLLGDIEISEFTEEIEPISTEEMRIIDTGIADKIGDKVLGNDPALGSVAKVDNFILQSINGKLYYVAPLAHSGFFKWKRFGHTTGYIKVSATNTNDVELVQEVGGEPIEIRYQPAAFFGDDLKRHIYFNGYATQPLTDYSFEVDDTGKPWWVVTKYENTIFFGGAITTGVLIVDPKTGAIKEYAVDEVPSWVDRVQPEGIVMEQVKDWGELINGWWNWSGMGMLTPSRGTSIVYGNDGQCYYYTGITSYGADESTTAFMMINTRSKKVYRYNLSGATEVAAMESAESQVQEKEYKATFPITYNVNGEETYFLSLIGNDGLPKLYAMINVKNYSIVGIGDDIRSTKRAYQRKLSSSGQELAINAGATELDMTVVVDRIQMDVVDAQSNYYLTFENVDDKVFVGSSSLSPKLPLTQTGDTVTIRFSDAQQELTNLLSFHNKALGIKVSEEMKVKQQYFDSVSEAQKE